MRVLCLTKILFVLLKHSLNMANTKLVFIGTENSQTDDHELVCYQNKSNEIYINISVPNYDDLFICLDKSTSIKLHRELKKQISFIESEGLNG